MKFLKLEIKDRLAILTLDRGKSNALNTEMMQELIAAVIDLNADENIGGLVITGKENFFSAGVDLIEVYHYDEQQVKTFWATFLQMLGTLASFKKPFVTAITGHSPAGGCIIAICSDYRVMAKGDYIIGLNEIPVGIIVPDAVFQLYSFWLGQRKAYQYLLEGKLLKSEEALLNGLVDELAEADDVLEAAEKKARSYMKFSPSTWQQSKLNLRKDLLNNVNVDHAAGLGLMLKQWWTADTRAILKGMVDKLTNPVKK